MSDMIYDCPNYPLLLILSGPSGVGKDTVARMVIERRPDSFYFVVTATTRPPRGDERHGVDYMFVTFDEFARMIEEDELLEYAVVYNDYKGIPKQQVRHALATGHDVIMRLDVQGAATVKQICPDAVTIFIAPASEEELVQRLRERKTETPEGFRMRIATARQELARMKEFDYYVLNRDFALESTVDTILAIIEAEHSRVQARQVNL